MKSLQEVNNVAIYLRRSRGEEEKDLEKHLLSAENICKQYKWSYTVYQEIGSGDSIEARPTMIELLEDVQAKVFDAVVVTYYDRLGRGSGTDQDIITNTFLNSDTLIIETYPFNVYNVEDDASEEMLAFKQFFARREYKSINKKLMHGRKMAVQMGRWVYSQKPYGYQYDKETKKLVINNEQAKAVRKMIEMYISGNYSTNDIAEYFNKNKVPSPKGKVWTPNTILNILKSEVYLGHIVYNKSKGNKQSKSAVKKEFQYIPKSKWKKVENAHMAIKTKDEHDKIMEILNVNRTKSGKNHTNALSGIVKCFYCKNTLPIMKSKEGDDVLGKCYRCNQCRGGQAEIVMNSIYKTLESLVEVYRNTDDSDLIKSEKNRIIEDINDINNKIETNKNALLTIERAMEDGLYDYEKASIKIKERNDIIFELMKRLEIKKNELSSINTKSGKDRIKELKKFYKDMEKFKGDKTKQNHAIKSLISSVIWKRDKWDEIEVTVNFK